MKLFNFCINISFRWTDLIYAYLRDDVATKKRSDLGQLSADYQVLRDPKELSIWINASATQVPHIRSNECNRLICVTVKVVGKGTVCNNAMICLPKTTDCGTEGPSEPVGQDDNEKARQVI